METHEDDHPQADPEDAVDLTHVTFIYRLFTISWGITFFLILTLYPIILLIEHFSTSSFARWYTPIKCLALFFFLVPFIPLLSGPCLGACLTFLFILIKLPFIMVWGLGVAYFKLGMLVAGWLWGYLFSGVKIAVFRAPLLEWFWRHWTFQTPRFGWESIPESRSKVGDEHHRTTSQLCEGCMGVIERSGLIVGNSRVVTPRREVHGWLLHIKGVEIRGEEQVACHLCNILWYSMERKVREDVANGMNYGRRVIEREAGGEGLESGKQEVEQIVQLNVVIYEEYGRRWYNERKRYIQVCASPGMAVQNNMRAFLISEESLKGESASIEVPFWTGAPDCIDLAREWIERCESEHDLCKTTNATTDILPTRLVYVGSLVSPELRIHTTSPGEDISYLALSHCWGKSKFESLSVENHESWCRGIELETLPANFQDAIHFTRSIGKSFVWIDSLCIIQDCPEDWAREAAKMSSVYSQAYCTISASGADEANGGCFRTRNPLMKFPCNLLFSDDDTLAIRTVDSASENDNFGVEVDASPLSKRAWAFQERLLSKRIVHFGANYLFFECSFHFASELLQGGQEFSSKRTPAPPKHFFNNWLSHFLSRFAGEGHETKGPTTCVSSSRYDSVTGYRAAFNTLRQSEPTLPSDTHFLQLRLHASWYELVTMYTSADLTNTSDRLIAIYGIAQGIQDPQDPPNYIAGLWKHHLPYDLLWHLDTVPSPRPRYPRAPSWSWGAIDGRVTQSLLVPPVAKKEPDFHIISTANIIAVEMLESTPGIAKGYIDLECHWFDITNLTYGPNRYHTSSLVLRTTEIPFKAEYIPDYMTEQPEFCVELVRVVRLDQRLPATWILETHGIALGGERGEIGNGEGYRRVGTWVARWEMDVREVEAYRQRMGERGRSGDVELFLAALGDAGRGVGEGGRRVVRVV
ncbi:hypothetical protein GLAREA_03459 [Glarea lozoyensis ATCC 20868]|uniref:Heterokaryon incompatibility domain-containing protein n=1 Tax=Glarea lozoyensis (strain ATCC 20868 / MF5171) TaxID=1116229 RepID=S3CVQ1_GLAL2|nr:uncharacterized protein GLAREA_03459 [Glarea lozoyensis ATCC 20868]EPE30492.1 hypothetical protein GLAREA_03459 [Glarea lozoyensis ATCC 20868]